MGPVSDENPESRRLTQFPGSQSYDHLLPSSSINDNSFNNRRETRFPSKPQYRPTLATTFESLPPQTIEEDLATNPQLPVSIQDPVIYTDNSSNINVRHVVPSTEVTVLTKNPWNTYRRLRNIAQGIKTEVACTRSVPVAIVTMREIQVAVQWDKVAIIRHQNIVHFIEAYNYMSNIILVSEFMQVSLKQVIAIPYDFQEVHVSTVCSQVLDGMQYLLKHQVFTKLDSSTAFLSSDGRVKIAHIGYALKEEPKDARAIGLLALEMMQKGVIQKEIRDNDDLVPLSPNLWSVELINFLKRTSAQPIEHIDKVYKVR